MRYRSINRYCTINVYNVANEVHVYTLETLKCVDRERERERGRGRERGKERGRGRGEREKSKKTSVLR